MLEKLPYWNSLLEGLESWEAYTRTSGIHPRLSRESSRACMLACTGLKLRGWYCSVSLPWMGDPCRIRRRATQGGRSLRHASVNKTQFRIVENLSHTLLSHANLAQLTLAESIYNGEAEQTNEIEVISASALTIQPSNPTHSVSARTASDQQSTGSN